MRRLTEIDRADRVRTRVRRKDLMADRYHELVRKQLLIEKILGLLGELENGLLRRGDSAGSSEGASRDSKPRERSYVVRSGRERSALEILESTLRDLDLGRLEALDGSTIDWDALGLGKLDDGDVHEFLASLDRDIADSPREIDDRGRDEFCGNGVSDDASDGPRAEDLRDDDLRNEAWPSNWSDDDFDLFLERPISCTLAAPLRIRSADRPISTTRGQVTWIG